MKRKLMCAAILALAVLLPMPLATAQQAPAEQEIRHLEEGFNAAYGANDLPAYFAYYAPDVTQWLEGGRTDLATYKKDWTSYISAGNRLQSAEFSDLHIQVSPSADAAVATYVLHVRTKLADGKITDEDFQETDVWFKRDGTWKVVELHYSAAPKKK